MRSDNVSNNVIARDPMTNKGIGPITSLTIGEIDEAMVAEGETIFKAKCTACHKITKKFVGPALKGVTQRRSPEWIMNMALNPEGMVADDPIAKKLLVEYNDDVAPLVKYWIIQILPK